MNDHISHFFPPEQATPCFPPLSNDNFPLLAGYTDEELIPNHAKSEFMREPLG